jgi:hypothetical protein
MDPAATTRETTSEQQAQQASALPLTVYYIPDSTPRGLLWLTHDGEPKDLILEPAERYRADRRSMLLVQALEEPRVELVSAD